MDLLRCPVQSYDWGDRHAIASLQGRPAPAGPEAELWMGAHPRGCGILPDGQTLAEAIDRDPVGTLGPSAATRFGQLPFLFKVLAAAKPLSIQSHPTLAQAHEGFERENSAGIPLDAPHRTYRDPNHKPELIVALTTFEAKCGFRPLDDARRVLAELDSADLDPVRSILDQSGAPADVYAEALGFLLSGPADRVRAIADATVRSSSTVAAGSPFAPELAWTDRIGTHFPGDVGVTVALLLNHVVLAPGEAIFLAAGNLHAYLHGVGVELMANSDNVVRGGLTSKHVDVDELLRVVDCTPLDAPVQRPSSPSWTYASPVAEFELDRLVGTDTTAEVEGPEILLVETGAPTVTAADGSSLETGPGCVVWVPAETGGYGLSGQHRVWRSRVGREVESAG